MIQPRLQNLLKKTDTCGVLYLHGLPGLLGGVAALFAVGGIDKCAQLSGIAVAAIIALVTGFAAGKVVSLLGDRTQPYADEEEFLIEEDAEEALEPAEEEEEAEMVNA